MLAANLALLASVVTSSSLILGALVGYARRNQAKAERHEQIVREVEAKVASKTDEVYQRYEEARELSKRSALTEEAAGDLQKQVDELTAMVDDKPMDPLADWSGRGWCINCDKTPRLDGFGFTADLLHYLCADCRRAYDDPNSVLNPSPAVVEQTKQATVDVPVPAWGSGDSVPFVPEPPPEEEEPWRPFVVGRNGDLLQCVDCGSLHPSQVIGYHDDEAVMVCEPCSSTHDEPWVPDEEALGWIRQTMSALSETPERTLTCFWCEGVVHSGYSVVDGNIACAHCYSNVVTQEGPWQRSGFCQDCSDLIEEHMFARAEEITMPHRALCSKCRELTRDISEWNDRAGRRELRLTRLQAFQRAAPAKVINIDDRRSPGRFDHMRTEMMRRKDAR